MPPPEVEKRCNFCGRPRNEVPHLATAEDGTSICNGCANTVSSALAKLDAKKAEAKGPGPLKKPREIMALLNQSVIGQDRAKREVAVAVYEHYRRREVDKNTNGTILLDGEEVTVEKSNILMLGPSGSGKTHIARAVARMLDVPFYVGDATKLTQAGYVGDDVESLLQGLLADAQQDVEKAQWGIVFLDEIDKLARKSGRGASGYRDITGEGVQQSLLKLLEGTRLQVPRGMGSRSLSGMNPADTIDTTNILFIGAGSFAGIEPIIEKRLNKSVRLGFGQEQRQAKTKTNLYQAATDDDLQEFGMIPEIVGRLPVLTSTYELTEDELVRILVEPRSAICKQFRALYSLDGIDLQFEPEALHAIAQEAKKRATGARALRSVLKAVLQPYSYEAPDNQDITAIRITSGAVTNPGSAVVIRKGVGVA